VLSEQPFVTAYRLAAEELHPAAGVRVALGCALVVLAAALGLAVSDARRR